VLLICSYSLRALLVLQLRLLSRSCMRIECLYGKPVIVCIPYAFAHMPAEAE
jgi:hypothetical protein